MRYETRKTRLAASRSIEHVTLPPDLLAIKHWLIAHVPAEPTGKPARPTPTKLEKTNG